MMLIFQFTGATLFMRYARSRQGPLFLSSTAVVFAEIIKLILSIGILWLQQHFNIQKLLELLMKELHDPIDNLKILIPSMLFVIQSNLIYFSITFLDAATFQVTSQLKILTTAFFSVLLLPNRRYSVIQWLALFILFIGVSLVQWEAQHLKVNSKPVSNNSYILFSQTTFQYNRSIPHSELKKSILDSTTPLITTDTTNFTSAQNQLKSINLLNYGKTHTGSTENEDMLQHINKPLMGLCAVILACISSGFAVVYFERVLKGLQLIFIFKYS